MKDNELEVDKVNRLIQQSLPNEQKELVSDGYHTFKELYAHRVKLFVRVNKDDLRAMMGGFDKASEQVVLATRNTLIREALTQGKSVIVDDTNFAIKHYETIVKIADEFSAKTEIKEFHTPASVCIQRDRDRANPVGAKVIREMAEQYKWGQEAPEFLPVIQDPSLPRAIICDIDGTLAHMNGRSPYDYSKVSEDMVDETIRGITDLYNNFVILVSGRPDSCRDDTEDWLENNGVQYTSLHMRKTGDNRNDTIVKREILDELIKKYYIEFTLDDRDRVVKMWRESGIKCLQVAYGDF